MKPRDESIAVVVFCCRSDYFFAKICIASIRYYYPSIKIYLFKDRLKGDFNSRGFCRLHNVDEIKTSRRYYGWSAAKLHFLLNNRLPKNVRYFCIDADIIFIGKVIDKLQKTTAQFVVHGHHDADPYKEESRRHYFEIDKIKNIFPNYLFPGYFFNGGHTLITTGIITKELLKDVFNPAVYPFYTNTRLFPTVDQSILNALLPCLQREQRITLASVDFAKWSLSFFEGNKNNSVELFKDGSFEYLVHYAGDKRTCKTEQMKGHQLLSFFKQQYLSKMTIPARVYQRIQDYLCGIEFINKQLYRKNILLMKLGIK